MTGGEVGLIVLLTVAAMLGGACLVLVVMLTRTLADLRRSLVEFESESAELLDELHSSARHAAAQVDRVERLVTAAETVEGRVDSATRLAQRTLQSPVVKALAIREGVRGASHRLRVGSDTGRRRARRKKAS
jgi:hypothetical protein